MLTKRDLPRTAGAAVSLGDRHGKDRRHSNPEKASPELFSWMPCYPGELCDALKNCLAGGLSTCWFGDQGLMAIGASQRISEQRQTLIDRALSTVDKAGRLRSLVTRRQPLARRGWLLRAADMNAAKQGYSLIPTPPE